MLGLSWLASSFGKFAEQILWLSLSTATGTAKHPTWLAAPDTAFHYGELQGFQPWVLGCKPARYAM